MTHKLLQVSERLYGILFGMNGDILMCSEIHEFYQFGSESFPVFANLHNLPTKPVDKTMLELCIK